MANVPHSGLTGSDLHESKGTAAAAANTVFVADGAGSGAYAKLPAAAISGLANPFGASLLHLRDVRASGTPGDSPTLLYTTRTLNTVLTNEIPTATLSSNQITLPAGAYFIESNLVAPLWEAGAGTNSSFQSRLQNTTAATTLVTAMPVQMLANSSVVRMNAINMMRGRFTLAATSVLEIQHAALHVSSVCVATGYTSELYADVLIWKVS